MDIFFGSEVVMPIIFERTIWAQAVPQFPGPAQRFAQKCHEFAKDQKAM